MTHGREEALRPRSGLAPFVLPRSEHTRLAAPHRSRRPEDPVPAPAPGLHRLPDRRRGARHAAGEGRPRISTSPPTPGPTRSGNTSPTPSSSGGASAWPTSVSAAARSSRWRRSAGIPGPMTRRPAASRAPARRSTPSGRRPRTPGAGTSPSTPCSTIRSRAAVIDYVGGVGRPAPGPHPDHRRRRGEIPRGPGAHLAGDPLRGPPGIRHRRRTSAREIRASAAPAGRLFGRPALRGVLQGHAGATDPVGRRAGCGSSASYACCSAASAPRCENDPGLFARACALLDIAEREKALHREPGLGEMSVLLFWPWVESLLAGRPTDPATILRKEFMEADLAVALPKGLRAQAIDVMVLAEPDAARACATATCAGRCAGGPSTRRPRGCAS